MATRYVSRFPTTKLPDCGPTSPCSPAPVCPACGGLECLCRPRFFAGQLLTEDDLNRLDDYITAKNRLHNRHLVGWGVACGLEVVCNACDPTQAKGSVIVKPGYALSPCGNDIVVCSETPVNVCDLIARCRPSDDMCLSAPGGASFDDCGGGTEDWVLGICYTEKASRGVTALLNQADPRKSACGCGGGCGCGGAKTAAKKANGSCGCGCGGQKAAARKAPPPECEPTLTCEGATFAAWKVSGNYQPSPSWGAAATRFICCVRPFLTSLGQYPTNASADELSKWYFDLREAVREFLLQEGLYDCAVAGKLAAATTPATGEKNDLALKSSVLQATYSLLAVAVLVVQKCFCAALLPPCPEAADTDCVPIATVTVKRRSCEVVKVCDISARKFLVTIPNIEYWLSFFTTFQAKGNGGFGSLKQLFEGLCCTDLERWLRTYVANAGDVFQGPMAIGAAAEAPAAAEAVAAPKVAAEAQDATSSPVASMLWQALATPGREVNAATLMLAAMGARDRKGQPLASDFELAHPTDFLLVNQVIAPVVRAMMPPATLGTPSVETTAAGTAGTAVDELAKQLAALKHTIEEQQKAIDQLRKSRNR
jgi:hypothetical protein